MEIVSSSGARDAPVQFSKLPLGIKAVEKLLSRRKTSSAAKDKTGYQIFIFCLTFWIYAIYTLTRRPFSVVKIVLCPPCANESFGNLSRTNLSNGEDIVYEGWPPFNSTNGKTLLGSVDYSLIFAYATGLYLSGYVADRFNRRYFLTIGMTGSGVFALLLGLGYFLRVYHLAYFIVFQVLAGFMQSTGWPGLLGVTGKWFGKKNRGKILGFWGSCSFLGSILGYVIPSFFISSESVADSPWGWAFIVPAIIIFATALMAFCFLVTDPKHLGFLPAQQNSEKEMETRQEAALAVYSSEEQEEKKMDADIEEDSVPPTMVKKTPTTSKGVGFLQALLLPGVVEYSLSFFFVKLVAYSFIFWLPFYVSVSFPDLGGRNAAWVTTLFDVGGVLGGVFIGVTSDLIKSRSIIMVPMLLIGVPVVLLLRSVGHISIVLYCFLVLLVGVFVNGPHIIIAGAVANDLGTHKSLRDDQHAMSIVSGIIDGTGSLGAAIGPLLVGLLTDRYGWDAVFYVLMAACFFSSAFLSRLVITDLKKFVSRCRSKRSLRTESTDEGSGTESSESTGSGNITAEPTQISAHNRTFEEILAMETTL